MSTYKRRRGGGSEMTDNSGGYLILGLVMLAAAIALYFLPAIVAGMNRHRQRTAIFILNLLLGWTAVGWVVALVWAFMRPEHPVPVVVNNQAPSPQLTRAPQEQASELEHFARLRDNGVLTEEEFQLKKRAILGLA